MIVNEWAFQLFKEKESLNDKIREIKDSARFGRSHDEDSDFWEPVHEQMIKDYEDKISIINSKFEYFDQMDEILKLIQEIDAKK